MAAQRVVIAGWIVVIGSLTGTRNVVAGDGNTGLISQIDSIGTTAQIEQIGSYNSAEILQISQSGSYSGITQKGGLQNAFVTLGYQYDAFLGRVAFDGYAAIDQAGSANFAAILTVNSSDAGIRIDIQQVGTANLAQIANLNSSAHILQTGLFGGVDGEYNNATMFRQSDYGGELSITQAGSLNIGDISQFSGANGYGTIDQQGYRNMGVLNQDGREINQQGLAVHEGHISQVGDFNFANINQYVSDANGALSVAAINQSGGNNSATVNQEGGGNTAIVWQY